MHPGDLYPRLQFEVAKYRDITTVLLRLEQQGFLGRIYSLFHEIITEEQHFTIKELQRMNYSLKPTDKFDVQAQFDLNCGIFRANLLLIVDSIVNRIWDTPNNIRYEEYQQPEAAETTPLKRGVLQTINENSEFLLQTASNNKSNSVQNTDTKVPPAKQTKKPQHQRVPSYDGEDKASNPTSRLKKGHVRQASLTACSPQTRVSHKDLNHTQPLPVSLEAPVELPSNKASKEDRRFIVKKDAPGPGQYNTEGGIDFIRRKSPSPKFNKSPKVSIFDKHPNNETLHHKLLPTNK
eukprot:TRINITY_DN438_c0_g1_i1.p1 TRINITY_DN438_c0_g1~~TRINITY_DN438_c0_g1_i1.p1  ORF type:complete len:293 (+),score=35.64 TRINITY_DN438_c0_g1_i1:79-957(+)